jgi:DNA repair protein RadC
MTLPKIQIKVTLTPGEKIKISNSTDAHNILSKLFSEDTLAWTEEVILLAVNKANEVYGWYRLSQGGTTGTILDPKVVFSILLNAGASGFMVAHNHPSGNLKPSQEDIRITKKLFNAGDFLDITLLDHIIITPNGSYLSMADEKLF